MDLYSNESTNQQMTRLKDFLLRYRNVLIVGGVIGILVLAGWLFSLNQKNKLIRQVTARYGEVIAQLKHTDPTAEELQQATRFVQDNQNTYGSLAALELSKVLVTKNNLAGASSALEQGLKGSKNPELSAILNLRLARIQVATNHDKAALMTLSRVKGDSWQVMVSDLQGDIYAHQGNKQAAREAWNKGIVSALTPALKQMMQTKLNNLG